MKMKMLLCCLTILALSVNGKLSESEYLLRFIHSVDPANNLRFRGSNPCLSGWKGIKCLFNSNSIVQVSLDHMNLSGVIDSGSLCNLPNLRILSLANNRIHGSIPATFSRCSNLRHLNLSSNLLNGSIPVALYNLKHLKTIDVSNNNEMKNIESVAPAPSVKRATHNNYVIWPELVVAILLLGLLAFLVNLRITKSLNKANIQSPPKTTTALEEVKREEKQHQHQDLVFFVEEKDQFKLENLLDAGADMQNQNYCSSLYKVQLEGGAYAVKRLNKLQGDFNGTMATVGKLNHPNLLPLVAYSCQGEEKLLIYKYQNKGSLLSLMERYVEGKGDFPWKVRLCIAVGIARGLDYIYRSRSSEEEEIIPHGNIKPSNILLNEDGEALISEYGYSNMVDPKSACLFKSNGYTAPERCLSEQGDVFSFGVILLELLTGKIVEKRGLDLPKWVKAMVREEWTGEVFDKEIAKVGTIGFPLLNVALKCVAHFAENRPSMAEVLETIVGVVDQDLSIDSTPDDHDHVLYSVPEEDA